MHRNTWHLVLFPLCVLVTGCDKIYPTVTAEDQKAARHAMPISEISLMVRSRYDQNKIIAEVQRRHVPLAIDVKTEESLVHFGAKPALIAALKNKANILTSTQKMAFDELAGKREPQIASARNVYAPATEQPDEQPRTIAVVSAPSADTPEETYWKAEADYRVKKKKLESQIASEQGLINWKRARGYHQSELASAENRLHELEDELKHLQAPMR